MGGVLRPPDGPKAWVEPKPLPDTMTGPQHYAEALRLLAAGAESGEYGARHAYAQAQIHAALAVAATFGTETAYGSTSREMRETRAEWAAVLANTRAGS